MFKYIAILILITFVVGLVIALLNLYMNSKYSSLAQHAENVDNSPVDWKTLIGSTLVLYVVFIAIAALVYTTGFGSFLLTFIAVGINMNMGAIMHRLLCMAINKANGGPVPMPRAA